MRFRFLIKQTCTKHLRHFQILLHERFASNPTRKTEQKHMKNITLTRGFSDKQVQKHNNLEIQVLVSKKKHLP